MQGKRVNLTKVFFEKVMKYGVSSFVFVIALGLGLIIVNYIIAVKAPDFDITRHRINTLSTETKTLLEDIDYTIEIKAFYPRGTEQRIRSIFDKYQAINKNLNVEYIDPIKNPLIAEQYDVSLPQTIIFESPGKQTSLNPPPRGRRHEERDITIAIYRLFTDETRTAYFTTGHGELNLENTKQDGINTIRDRLIEQNYIVTPINILEEGEVPEDCSVLIVAGPRVPFTDIEKEVVEDFLVDKHGNLFLLHVPGIETNLEDILYDYGVEFGNDYVYETSSRLTTDQFGPTAPLCVAQDSSDVTGSLPYKNVIMPYVRSVNIGFLEEHIKVTKLLKTGDGSWGETDITSAKRARTNQRPTRDDNEKKGPLTVAMLSEREFPLPDSLLAQGVPLPKARMAFYGSASCIMNSFVISFPANLNFFLNTVNWITRNEKIIEITPNIRGFTPIELRQSQRKLLRWLTLFILPFTILAIGFVIWFRRR